MKKMFFACMIALGTIAFTACESKTTNTENDESVVDRDTIVETDTTVTETVVESDTTTRQVGAGEGEDTLKK